MRGIAIQVGGFDQLLQKLLKLRGLLRTRKHSRPRGRYNPDGAMTFRTIFAACLLALSALSGAQLTQFERKGLDDTLFLGNLTESDLGYARRPANALSH